MGDSTGDASYISNAQPSPARSTTPPLKKADNGGSFLSCSLVVLMINVNDNLRVKKNNETTPMTLHSGAGPGGGSGTDNPEI